jgi:hypothetical protein
MELSPVPRPLIHRIDGRLYLTAAVGRCEIVASHGDRTRARWWRLIGPDGRALSPWVGAVAIAAAWAASATSERV